MIFNLFGHHGSSPTLVLAKALRASLALILCFWAANVTAQASGLKNVLVSTQPYALILNSTLPAEIDISVLIEPGASPHDFQLRPSHLKKIAQADLVVWGGESLEPFLAKAFKPTQAQVKVSEIQDLYVIVDGAKDLAQNEAHNHNHDHNHRNSDTNSSPPLGHKAHSIDPHVWLHKHNAQLIALESAKYLDHSEKLIQAIKAKFSAKTDEQTNTNNLQNSQDAELVVYHNAYSYLEESLNIKHDVVLKKSHNNKPTLRDWQAFAERLVLAKNKKKSICIITLPGYEFSSEAKQVEKLLKKTKTYHQARFVELDPLGSQFGNQDYFEFLNKSKRTLLDCLYDEPKG